MYIKYFAVCFFLVFTHISYAQVVTVINKNNMNTLTKKHISRIFLGKDKQFPDGSETIPVSQAKGSSLQDSFNEAILGRSTSQVAAYWSRLVFTGKGIPPKEVEGDAAVIDLVSKNQSAIGYIDQSAVTDAVKVIKF